MPHSGRLFAATGQWEYPGASASGQVLVKKSKTSPWAVFEKTQSLRVQALDSFPIPSDQGLGPGHSLLVTQAIVAGRSRIQWLLDGANSFSLRRFVRSAAGADVRAFGAHEAGGVWSVYAGVRPTGVLRGVWSPARHTLVFNPNPELTVAPPGSPGAVTQKVTGFAECGGSAVHHHQHDLVPAKRRRAACRHPSLGPGLPRATGGAAQQRASRHHLRRATTAHRRCSSRRRATATCTDSVISRGARSNDGEPSPGSVSDGLAQTLEFQPAPAIRQMLAAQGTVLPGNRSRLDRVRDRRLQQRRLPDDADRRRRPAGVRVRVGLSGSVPEHAALWTDRLRHRALQRERLLCHPD